MDFGSLIQGLGNAIGGFAQGVAHSLGINLPKPPQQQQAPQPQPQQPAPQQQPQQGLNLGALTDILGQTQPNPNSVSGHIQQVINTNPVLGPVQKLLGVSTPTELAAGIVPQVQGKPSVTLKNGQVIPSVSTQGRQQLQGVGVPKNVASKLGGALGIGELGAAMLGPEGDEGSVAAKVASEGEKFQGAAAAPERIAESGAPKAVPPTGEVNIPAQPAKVNPLVKTVAPKSSILNSMGQHGKALVNLFNKQFNDYEVYKTNIETALKPFLSLGKNDQETVRNVLNGTHDGSPIAPKVQAGVDAVQKTMPLVHGDANAAGLDIGQIPNYFPRVTDWSKMEEGSPTWNTTIQNMVNSGRASDLADAAQKLSDAKNQATGYYKSGNLIQSRIREDELPQLPAGQALSHYLTGAADTITKARNFGPHGEALNEHLSGLISDGHDGQVASQVIKQIVNPRQTNKVLANIRGVGGFLQLSKAAISHSTQLQNTATVQGFGRTAQAIGKFIFSKGDRAYAKATGVYQSIHGINEQSGMEGLIGKGTAPGLGKMMQFNRGVTAVAGRDAALSAAKAGDADRLAKDFGLDPTKLVRNEKGQIQLTNQQLVDASRNLVQKTMFRSHPLDTPLWAETNAGKFVGQYRMAYTYKQTGFILKQVLNEAKNGNLAPLMRFVVGAPIATGAVLEAKHLLGGQAPTPTTVTENSLGIPGEMAGQVPYIAKGGPGAAEAIAGEVAPLAGTATQAAVNTNYALHGDVKPLERQGLSSIPVVGTAISHAVVPPASQQTINYVNTANAAQSQFLKNPGDMDQWKALHPGANNTPIDVVAHYAIYQSNPNVFKADQYIALHNPDTAPVGKHAPIFDLTPQQANDVFNVEKIKNSLPGSTSQFAKTDADYIKNVESSSWYQNYSQANGQYYQYLASQGVVTKQTANAYTPPTPQQTQLLNQMNGLSGSAMAQFINENQPLQQYLSQHAAEANIQRADLNLPPLPVFPEPPNQKVAQEAVAYDKLPTGTGARSKFLKANPDFYAYWQQQQNYYSQVGSTTSSTSTSGKSSSKSSTGAYFKIHDIRGERKIIEAPRLGQPKHVQVKYNPIKFKTAQVNKIHQNGAPAHRQAAPSNSGIKSTNDTIRST